ncbi:PQQ-like beta-propeller repeat protein [Candidatus Woesearchaeota archaeon]|nr:PQQ-like beta-propeller repeat protein [Candidatus Woesearchaeota archaeon]
MKKEAFLIILLLTIGVAAAQLADSPWPGFNQNNQRTGVSPYDTSHIDGTIKWVYEAGTSIQSSPAIGKDGTVYVGIDDGYFYAFNPDNGEIKWKTKIGTPLQKEQGYADYTSTLTSPGIAEDGTIYTASRDQLLYAFNPDGTEKWRLHLDLTFDNWGSPAIADDGTIYMTSSNPRPGVIAINPDGTEKWFFKAGTNMFNSVSIGKDGTIYAALPTSTKTNAIFAINPDGTEKWSYDTHLFIESTLMVADDGTVYGGTFAKEGPGYAGVYAIKNGEKLWYFETESSTESMPTPSIKDNTLYFGADDSYFYALNLDGTVKWKYKTAGFIEASPSIGADGTIYIGTSNVERGNPSFYAFNPDGTVKWTNSERSDSIISSAAIGKDGSIYVGSFGGVFYAFGETDEPVLEKDIVSLKHIDQGILDEGIDCSNPENFEMEEKCDMYCYDNPQECPDYFELKGEGKKGLFAIILDWFRNLFR